MSGGEFLTEWEEVARTKGGIHIKEQAETGTVISGRLLEMGTAILDGVIKQVQAIAEARELIGSGR